MTRNLLKIYPSERYLNNEAIKTMWMRATITLKEDISPIIHVSFSYQSLEWLSENDIVSYFSTIRKGNIMAVNSGMIGVSVSQNGSYEMKHDYRTTGKGTIETAIAHFFELTQEQYNNLITGNKVSQMTKNNSLVDLLRDDNNSSGSRITLYRKGYLASYKLPNNNPYI